MQDLITILNDKTIELNNRKIGPVDMVNAIRNFEEQICGFKENEIGLFSINKDKKGKYEDCLYFQVVPGGFRIGKESKSFDVIYYFLEFILYIQ